MEGEPRRSQEKEEFAGPEQDVQKAAAFEIIKILGMETDVERLAGTLFDESSHRSQVDGLRAEAAAPGVQALEVLIEENRKCSRQRSCRFSDATEVRPQDCSAQFRS